MKKLAFIKRSNGNHWVGDGFPVQSIFSYRDIASDISPFPRPNAVALASTPTVGLKP
jgi:hypothetical protein